MLQNNKMVDALVFLFGTYAQLHPSIIDKIEMAI
jgi:hypothetical protein